MTAEQIEVFLKDLTALSRQHSIVILQYDDPYCASPPVLEAMDENDHQYGGYRAEAESPYLIWYRAIPAADAAVSLLAQ